jgi:hypothetical protein
MDYDKHYDKLIARAKERNWTRKNPADIYKEHHHVLPRCLFPEFADLKQFPDNGVFLTAREHFIAHQLLMKMNIYKNHKQHFELVLSVHMMCVSNKIKRGVVRNNKEYDWIKREFAAATGDRLRGKKQSAEHVAKRKATIKRKKEKPGYIDPNIGRPSPKKGKPGPKQSQEIVNRRVAAGLKTRQPKILKNAFKKCAERLLSVNKRKHPSKSTTKKRIDSMLKTIHAPEYVNPKKGRQAHNKGKPRKPRTKEVEEKRRKSMLKTTRAKGYVHPNKGKAPWNKGKKEFKRHGIKAKKICKKDKNVRPALTQQKKKYQRRRKRGS